MDLGTLSATPPPPPLEERLQSRAQNNLQHGIISRSQSFPEVHI